MSSLLFSKSHYLALVATLLLLTLVLTVHGEVEGLEEALHHQRDDERIRDYTYNIRSSVADIRAEGLDFRISVNSADGPKISASYRSGGGAERYKFKMFIKRLVEYVPDSVDGFQRGRDEIVNIYGSGTGGRSGWGRGSNWEFDDFVDVNPDSTEDRRFYVVTKDGVFNISFRVNAPPGEVLSGNLTLGLNDIKFDVSIDMDKLMDLGFLARNDTELAIMGVLQSRLRRRFCDANSTSDSNSSVDGSSDDDGSVCINDDVDGGVKGYIRWLNELNCNNTDVGLKVTRIDDDDGEADSEMHSEGSHATVISWTLEDPYNATGICKWDPIFHLSSESAASSKAAAALASASAFVIALLNLFHLF